MDQVHFFYKNVSPGIRYRKKLRKFVASIFRSEGVKLNYLNYIFCTDRELLKINRAYLKHNFYSDIVSFTLSNPSEDVQGEIYISIDRVRENAPLYESSFS